MIKAVLFDLDGTLLDRDASVKWFIEEQYEKLDKQLGHVPKEKYISRFIELDNHGYVWKDKVYQQLVNEFQIEDLTWEELLGDYIREFKNYCVPFPNLISMLEQLKQNNLVLGMITNGFGQFQIDNIKSLGIEPYFDTILVSEWEGMKKPNPQIFMRAIEKLNVSPSECIFVGDHPVNDVRAAQDVGMLGIWKKGMHWIDAKGDFILADLGELPLMMKKIIII